MTGTKRRLGHGLTLVIALTNWMALPVQAQGASPGHVERERVLATELPFQANAIDLQQALREISRLTGVPVIVSGELAGTVTLRDPAATLSSAMNALSGQTEAVWWFDGAAVRVEQRADMVSLLVPLGDVPGDLAVARLASLGLSDQRFPLRLSDGGEFLRVVGPSGYGAAVTEVIAQFGARITERRRAIRQAAQRDETDPDQADLAGLPVIVRGPGRN